MNEQHAAEKGAHEHDFACAFGSPTCPAFGEEPPPRIPWWRRLTTRPTTPGGSDA